MRVLISTVSGNPVVSAFFQRGPGRALSRRFVAGETLDEALAAARALADTGCRVALDYLGESVKSMDDAESAAKVYLETISRIPAVGAPVSLSIKPSQLGLDISFGRCKDLLRRIALAASLIPTGVRLDMEDSRHTDSTLRLWRELRSEGISVGVVLQAALRRSLTDLDEVLTAGGSVRLCKGAYSEPASIAYPDKPDVDRSYEAMLERLLKHAASSASPTDGYLPIAAIATHDERLIQRALDLIQQLHPPPAAYEFQMLFGIRRELQQTLVNGGYPLRVYTPWGPSWYPYLTRRLGERPANLLFVASALLTERLARPGAPRVTEVHATRRR